MNGVVFFQVGGEVGGAKFAAAVGVDLARVKLGVGHEAFVREEEVRLLLEEVKVFRAAEVANEYDEVGDVGEASRADFA